MAFLLSNERILQKKYWFVNWLQWRKCNLAKWHICVKPTYSLCDLLGKWKGVDGFQFQSCYIFWSQSLSGLKDKVKRRRPSARSWTSEPLFSSSLLAYIGEQMTHAQWGLFNSGSFNIIFSFSFFSSVLVFFCNLQFSLYRLLINFLLPRSTKPLHQPAVPPNQEVHDHQLGKEFMLQQPDLESNVCLRKGRGTNDHRSSEPSQWLEEHLPETLLGSGIFLSVPGQTPEQSAMRR